MVVVAYNLIKNQYSGMAEIVITKDKDYRAYSKIWKDKTIETTITHMDLMWTMSTISRTVAIQVGITIGRQLVKIWWADHKEIKAKHIFPVKYRTRVLFSIECLGQRFVWAKKVTYHKPATHQNTFTGNYVQPSTELKNLTKDSIRVRIPDARHIQSTHCGELLILQS